MRRPYALPLAFALATLFLEPFSSAHAACTVPNQLTNGQTADASQVMGNFNSVLTCVNTAPAGSTNALQYKAGTGTFGAVGPLTNGQIAIGSTGGPPVAATITAGSGISVTNGPGSITISGAATPYTAPKLTNFTWGNQPSGTTGTDTSTGLAMYQPNQNAENLGVLWDKTAIPASTPFTVTIGLDLSSIASAGQAAAGLAIGDGSGKFVSFEFYVSGSYNVTSNCQWTNYATYSGGCTTFTVDSTMTIMQINYDGTNFNISAGSDINSLVPVGTYSASSFISAPTKMGLYLRGYSTNGGVTFFHYHRTA